MDDIEIANAAYALAGISSLTQGEWEKLIKKIKRIADNGYTPMVIAKESLDKKEGTL